MKKFTIFLLILISLLLSQKEVKADMIVIDMDTIAEGQIMTFCQQDTVYLFSGLYPSPDSWWHVSMTNYTNSPVIIITNESVTYENNLINYENTNGNWTLFISLMININFSIYFTPPAVEPWINSIQAVCGSSDTLYVGADNCHPGFHYQWSLMTSAGTYFPVVNGDGYYPNDTIIIVSTNNSFLIQITSGCNSIIDTIATNQETTSPPTLGDDISFCGESVNYTTVLNNSPFSTLYNNYLWSTGETTATIDITAPGVYSVTASNNCVTGSDTIEIFQEFYPELDLGPDIWICEGASYTITSPWNYDSWTWQHVIAPGINGEISSLTIYSDTSVYMYAHHGACPSMRDTINFFISHPYDETHLCVVTVDQVTGKNKITWEKEEGVGIESFNIYKKITLAGDYAVIGNVMFSDPAEFIDMNSNPDQYSSSYKVSVVDTCGNESAMSPYHQGIFITHSFYQGIHSLIIQDEYVDEAGVYIPEKYYILEDTTGTGFNYSIIDSITSSAYSLIPVPGAVYAMAITQINGCTNTSTNLSNKNISIDVSNMIMSNKILIEAASVNELSNSNIFIYPNPSTGIFNITGQNIEQIDIFNSLGQQILLIPHEKIRAVANIKIDLSNFDKGIYYVRIKTSLGVVTKKLVVK